MDAMVTSPYFLKSERHGFRIWSPDDGALALGLWGDADVTRWIGGTFSEAQVQERLATEIARQAAYGIQYWPIFLLANGQHVGCCGLRPYDLTQPIHEIGFHIRKAYWGQGYAHESATAVIRYAFDVLGVKGLFAGHNPANEASRRLLMKLGFTYTHAEYYPPTGLNHPSYLLRRDETRS